jgi:hypothetical protein
MGVIFLYMTHTFRDKRYSDAGVWLDELNQHLSPYGLEQICGGQACALIKSHGSVPSVCDNQSQLEE